jgi:hypothetical protein
LCFLPALASLAFAAGCAMTESRTYDVTVRNRASTPVTIWLTKDGPPSEYGWLTPEQMTQAKHADEHQLPYVTLRPGESVRTGPRTGAFDRGVSAVLRVYVGERTLDDVLAVNRTSPNRTEVRLHPGESDLTISDNAGTLAVRASGSVGTQPR